MRILLTIALLLMALPARADDQTILMVVTSAARMDDGHPTGLWLEEFAVPYDAFRKTGYQVVVASPKGGAAPIDPRSADDRPEWREAREALKQTWPLATLGAGDFAAVFLPGGHGTMFDFPQNAALAALLTDFAARGKPIAAVCHGPAGLVGAKAPDGRALVAGRRVTGFTNSEERAVKLEGAMPFLLETRLKQLGGEFEGGPDFQPHVVTDGRLVTGQNPASSAGAAQAILRLLGGSR